jgi:hypothetical protein
MAPTAMKTVPSGSVEWFIKGAFWVGGIVGGGYSGISVEMVVLVRLGMGGRVPCDVVEEEPRPGRVGMGLDDDTDVVVRWDVVWVAPVVVVWDVCWAVVVVGVSGVSVVVSSSSF